MVYFIHSIWKGIIILRGFMVQLQYIFNAIISDKYESALFSSCFIFYTDMRVLSRDCLLFTCWDFKKYFWHSKNPDYCLHEIY